MIRTTKVVSGTKPYDFNAVSKYQCTWFAFWRVQEEGLTPPTYLNKATKSGKYPNAKLWLDNNREDWEVKGTDYQPQHMDIAVFDGTYGHVIVIEENNNGTCLCSDYNRVAKETYASFKWKANSSLSGCGKLLGYLHKETDKTDYKKLYEEAMKKINKAKEDLQ